MSNTTPNIVERRTAQLVAEHQQAIHAQTDHLLAGLLTCEWLAALILALARNPLTWEGSSSAVNPHVWAASVLGGAIVSLPFILALKRPGTVLTRHVTAAAQMLMSALLIHLGGGRIEMHFHVFGSLAFLAFYRDWKVLITGSAVIAVDHILRGGFLPTSVFGVTHATVWRAAEHAGWVIFEDLFLVPACIRAVREMWDIARTRALLEQSNHEIELKVEQRTRELKDAQEELVKAARSAGMAEIATSVLHNVGNVLNSVNVSATVVADRIKQSEVPTLRQVSDLIVEHQTDLGTFMTRDERGQALPAFIADLSSCLAKEQDQMLSEIVQLSKGVDHIKQIIASQQSMARRTTVQAMLSPARLIDTAITIQSSGRSSELSVEREIDPALPASVRLDEHKVLQILINLLSNARHAVASRAPGDRSVRVRLTETRVEEQAMLRFAVTDNGVGIAPENLTRIFGHGFTTKKEGHGFGLHSAANAAREMGGSLTVRSDGVGKGATFVLELPLMTEADGIPMAAPTESNNSNDSTKEPTTCH